MKSQKRTIENLEEKSFMGQWGPWVVAGLFFIYLLSAFRAPSVSSLFNFNSFGQLPVLNGGRLKPMDSMARSSLLVIHGKQTLSEAGNKKSAIEWLCEVMFSPEKSDKVALFQIDNPDVLGLMGVEQTKNRYFSFSSIRPHIAEIERQAALANELKSEKRNTFQTAIVNLANKLYLYHRLQNTLQVVGLQDTSLLYQRSHDRLTSVAKEHMKTPSMKLGQMPELSEFMSMYSFLISSAEFLPIPGPENPADSSAWLSMGQGLMASLDRETLLPGVLVYATLGDAYRAGDASIFNQALSDYQHWLQEKAPAVASHVFKESLFNRVAPFYKAMVLYVFVFIGAVLSWLARPIFFRRSAFFILLLAFMIHTIAILTRMILQGRPPVTNLYSSAIFVGWVSVLLGIILEKISRRGLGSAVASTIGFITLIIAHHLSAQGDTLEMMRAVLDSNFWLATHVVCITIGYSSTFLSGFLASLFLIRRVFDKKWNQENADEIERMAYGVVCFSTFFSFLGTILGGVWADQSWGRFWGWDPKENGALLIVLWNAFLLHARWGRVVRSSTWMALGVFGNVVTALSWFGVNMLGIGLHSYGFMDKAFVWLMIFIVSQVVIMSLVYFPERIKKSFSSHH